MPTEMAADEPQSPQGLEDPQSPSTPMDQASEKRAAESVTVTERETASREGEAKEDATADVADVDTADVSSPSPTDNKAPSDGDKTEGQYIKGWRLHVITLGLLMGMFLSQMESSVTSTAIISITDELGGYEKSSWVFTAYWLAYCGFQMIWAKLSDITGRKLTFLTCLFIFIVFSGALAASQNIIDIIMMRWVQGMGGCGVFALGQLIFFELVPPRKWSAYVSLVTAVIAISQVVGPLIGGAITLNESQWRWIFLLNAPAGAIAFLIIFLSFPTRLFNEPAAQGFKKGSTGVFSFKNLRRVDILGSILLLGSCLLVSTGLQQAAVGYSWTSAFVLPLLITTAPFAIAFLLWEWFVTRRSAPEPVFPWRFCQSRIRTGMILNTALVGCTFTICTVQIPQRFMTVNGLSPFQAGLRLLPFGAFVPTGTSLAAGLMGKPKIPACVIILVGAAMQLVGVVFLSRASTHPHIDASQYGWQILAGCGTGFVIASLVLLVPYVMEKRDLATGSAAVSQFRILGGLVGVSVATALSTPFVKRHLLAGGLVTPDVAFALLERPQQAMATLDPDTLAAVRVIFGQGYNLQMKLLMGTVAAQFPVTLLMWTNKVVSTDGK